jgi:peptide/nickel transport system permease protein
MRQRARDVASAVLGVPKLSLAVIATFIIAGLCAPLLAPHDPNAPDLLHTLEGASAAHPLGTDDVGRDELSRILEGARTSLTAAGLVLGGALVIGLLIGAIAAMRGGLVDELLMRITDVGLSLPSLITALATIGLLGPSYGNMILALTIVWWPPYARLTRALIISIKKRPYIEAVQLMGARPSWIMLRHLLPAAVGPVLVYATADAGFIALAVATLSFLGLGVQPPTPEWGQMLVSGLPFLETRPGLVIYPGLALTLVVVGFNLLGEAVAMDKVPRPLSRRALRRRRTDAAVALAAADSPAKPGPLPNMGAAR